jgi:hypothetical protein
VINHDKEADIKKNIYKYAIDIKTYPVICKEYLNNGVKPNDYTQILDICTKYQKWIMSKDDLSQKEKIKSIEIISKYYENVVLQFTKDYFELPKEYNGSNYVMTIIIDIIVHIVKRIICAVIFELIVKALAKYVMETFPNTVDTNTEGIKYESYIAKLIINAIDKSSERGSRLMNHIFNVMPIKIVKIILQIYEGINEGEDDIDRTLTLESLFEEISKILAANTSVDIASDSSLIKNLKQYIYPYCIDYLEMFVKDMKNVMDNYLRSQQYQAINLQLLDLLINPPKDERYKDKK